MDKEEKYSIHNIQPLSRSEWFKVSLFDRAELDSLYVIMGFLQECFGGYSLHEETVDLFFVNELEKVNYFSTPLMSHKLRCLRIMLSGIK